LTVWEKIDGAIATLFGVLSRAEGIQSGLNEFILKLYKLIDDKLSWELNPGEGLFATFLVDSRENGKISSMFDYRTYIVLDLAQYFRQSASDVALRSLVLVQLIRAGAVKSVEMACKKIAEHVETKSDLLVADLRKMI